MEAAPTINPHHQGHDESNKTKSCQNGFMQILLVEISTAFDSFKSVPANTGESTSSPSLSLESVTQAVSVLPRACPSAAITHTSTPVVCKSAALPWQGPVVQYCQPVHKYLTMMQCSTMAFNRSGRPPLDLFACWHLFHLRLLFLAALLALDYSPSLKYFCLLYHI